MFSEKVAYSVIPLFRYSIFHLFLSPVCDGCRVPFSTEHALDCHFGSLVTHRHDEVLDAVGDLASLVWTPVVKEPVVCDGSAGADTLIADLCVCGSGNHKLRHCLILE